MEPYLDFALGFAFIDMSGPGVDDWPRNFTLGSTLGLRADDTATVQWGFGVRGTAWIYWPYVFWPFEVPEEPMGATAEAYVSVAFSF